MVNSVHFPPRCVNLKTISLPTCFGQERYLGSNDDYSSNMKNNQKAWWISRAAAEKTRNTALCRFAPGTKADTILVKSGEGNGNPLQCSCLENPRDGGAWTDHAMISCLIMHWSRGYHALITWLIMQWSRSYHSLVTWLIMHWSRG